MSELIKHKPLFPAIFMRLAFDLSDRSECKRAAVGCVVTDKEFTQVYGIGYNGGARKDSNRCSAEPGNCGCVHAEANALIKCRTIDTEKVLFTTTYPCKVCAKMIVNSGVSAVYFGDVYRDSMESHLVLRSAGIKLFSGTSL